MKITLRKQILAFTIIPVVIISAILSFISVSNIISMGEARVAAYRETLLSQKRRELTHCVEVAISMIENQNEEQAKETIRKLKYGDNDYFWINDFNNIMVSHPDPKLNGADQTNLQDPNGVYIVRELTKVCKEYGQGFVSYYWKKLGADNPSPKLSFVKKVDKWNWMVGTGLYVDDIASLVAAERERTQDAISSLIMKNVTISILVAVVMSLLVAYFLGKHVNGPINQVINTMKNLDYDLTVRINNPFKYEIGELANQFNDLIDEMYKVISKVSDATLAVIAWVSEISSTVEEQAAISTEQSASVSEITSTMEEFSATSKQIAEHSNAVVGIASRALETTKKGAEAVESVMSKMKAIHDDNMSNTSEIVELGMKSKEISKVMEIINNIADQTKLIAFNAALEASSAGEAGKRFGVVAAEIRRLADSVMESTGDIDAKINEIQQAINRLVIVSEKGSKRIEEGLDLSNQTADLLADIVSGAKSTANAAKQISLSTQQQETAGDQVLEALKEIDAGARQTSISISQISSSASDLKRLSENLVGLVKKFKLSSPQGDHGKLVASR